MSAPVFEPIGIGSRPMDGTELTCQALVELVTDYLEQKLSPQEQARFEAHLATCDGCDAYLEQMRQTITPVGALREESIPPETQEELLHVFRN